MNDPHSKLKHILWTIIALCIGILSAFVMTKTFGYEKIPSKIKTIETTIQAPDLPKNFYFIKDLNQKPKVSALAYLVGDLDTGEVIMQKNADQKLPIASISKLMTALVATELTGQDDISKISQKALSTLGENGGFYLGEKIKTSELVYPLLLESSNDAAEIIAEQYGRDSFLQKMNQQAEKLEMSSTSYEDPSGLSQNNQSSASDLFKLTGYLNQKKPEILQITTKRSYVYKKHSWYNISQFLHEDGYLGGKSGFTDQAKQTAVSTFVLPLSQSGSRHIAITLLHTPDRYKDIQNLVKYLKKNIYYGGEADANTVWVKEKEGVPEIAEPDFVTLAFAGDIMLDRGVKNSVMKNFGGDYSALFENLDILKKADIAFANLEGPASDQGKDIHNLYSFRMDPSTVPALKGAGFSILSVANNHVGDWGREAYTDTLARLNENEILYTGGGKNSMEAETPTIIEKYGMKIGYLAFSDKGPDSMQATTTETGVLLANNPRFDKIIQNASSKVDYLVVSLHFGEEYQTKHNSRQEFLAHKAIDDGAKIIIGAHPHVVEDTEVYSPRSCTQSSCMGFIAYSLGNLIFDQYFSANTMQGMLLELKLHKDGSMSITKDIVPLSSAFQPGKIVKGKEEKIKFQEKKYDASR